MANRTDTPPPPHFLSLLSKTECTEQAWFHLLKYMPTTENLILQFGNRSSHKAHSKRNASRPKLQTLLLSNVWNHISIFITGPLVLPPKFLNPSPHPATPQRWQSTTKYKHPLAFPHCKACVGRAKRVRNKREHLNWESGPARTGMQRTTHRSES